MTHPSYPPVSAVHLHRQFNFNGVSKARAGRVLGRCHAAQGQHTLSVSALDAALQLASTGQWLAETVLALRAQVVAGRAAGSAAGGENSAVRQRLAVAVARMQLGGEAARAEVLEQLLA